MRIQRTLRPTPARHEVYVEFDGQQLAVNSDTPEVLDLVAETYQAMLVPHPSASIGRIEIQRDQSDNGSADIHGSIWMGMEVKDKVQRQFMRARPDLLWIHAGAVARDEKCLLIPGPSRSGKSTLSTLLCEQGWGLLSDEFVPIRTSSLEVLPFPQQPTRRIYPGHDVPLTHIGILGRETVEIPQLTIHRDPARISRVVFPVFRGRAKVELVVIPAGEVALELIRNCMNFVDIKEAAVDRVSQIARAVPAHRLFYENAAEAAHVLDAFV